ncbi:MAG: hypothetical protein NTAFB05_06270 [Nitrobacter sp.]|uniref:DUF6953 family protein n=1 Tax=Nitrobacter sp. TaxID=29420 RepID=UPI00387DE98C
MADEVFKRRTLDQTTAVHEIERLFGKEFVYENENGNLAINRAVLAELEWLFGKSGNVDGVSDRNPTNPDDSKIDRLAVAIW